MAMQIPDSHTVNALIQPAPIICESAKQMAPSRSRSKSRNRHVPLEEDILKTGPLKTKSNKRKARPETEEGSYVDSKSSRKILKIGRDLEEEEQLENAATRPNPAFTFESRIDEGDASEEENTRFNDEEAWGDEDDVTEEAVRCKVSFEIASD